MKTPPSHPVIIPLSPRGAQLARAEAIKREMTELLQELETQAARRPIANPGAWRHHPQDWPPPPTKTRPTETPST